ncbi:MAG: S8 family serine peptidase [Bacteroidota bacterium]|nr:S8 family serine peptidase [Bacteroidota bacterium]
MRKILSLLILCFLVVSESQAQFTRYVVKLKNKGGTPYTIANPSAYLSQRAIDRRARYGIAIDSTDLPVPPSYITQIRNIPNLIVLNVSKWLNSVTIQTSDPNAITAINALPFVQSASAIGARTGVAGPGKYREEENIRPVDPFVERIEGIEGDYFNYGTNSFTEIHLHKGEFLHDVGLRGQNMQIALLDAGFTNYTSLKAFDSINLNGQVLGTWNFVLGNTNLNVHVHGMECLSTIAANIPGQFIGKAPKAGFYLYCTEEDPAENPIEEHNWACGAEKADSSGADVISTSLGYTTFDNPVFDHTYADMNGNTTMAAIAADLAAKKGLLVFAANGNDGGDTWHYLSTPADGDSVVAVGAVSATGIVGNFSSYGPSSDGRIKPDVASIGVSALIEGTGNTVAAGSGTSFACPNMAGLGTCLWQGFPEFNNMRIVRALKEAGSIFNAPDNRIGYGIPDMKAAFSSLLKDYATSSATANNCSVTLNWNSKDVSAMKYEIERKAPGENSYTKIADMSPQAGNILANHTYQYTNTLDNIAAGTISYRIRQVIDTAAATFAAVYIDTANVTLASACTTGSNTGANKIYVQPNPASSDASLVIQIQAAITNMPITVHDMEGRLVMQLHQSKGTGTIIIDLPVNNLAKGKYIITVYDNQKMAGTTELLKL